MSLARRVIQNGRIIVCRRGVQVSCAGIAAAGRVADAGPPSVLDICMYRRRNRSFPRTAIGRPGQ